VGGEQRRNSEEAWGGTGDLRPVWPLNFMRLRRVGKSTRSILGFLVLMGLRPMNLVSTETGLFCTSMM
jgi:hypothetical protein